ncbi:centrosomal protein of 89 kDa-like [Convolutriloba macropyga]|uniref:centrosomal protein of 89 kDa-like n=1 Tax=Convolutriloba macropyga TaxID=536237 RepID=UPI003F5241E6
MGKKKEKPDDGSMLLARAFLPHTLIAATPEVSPELYNANPIHMAIVNAGNMAASFNFIDPNYKSSKENARQSGASSANARTLSHVEGYEDMRHDLTYPDVEGYHSGNEDEVDQRSDLEGSLSMRGSFPPSPVKVAEDTMESSSHLHQYSKVATGGLTLNDENDLSRSASRVSFKEDTERDLTSSLKEENQKLQLKLRDVIKQINELQTQKENYMISLNEREYTIRTLNKTVDNLQQENTQLRESLSGMRERTVNETEMKDTKTKQVSQLHTTMLKMSDQLKAYQDKLGIAPEKLPVDDRFQKSKPDWLTNNEVLSPLMLAYEDEINQKDAQLDNYEKKLKEFQETVDEVVQENRQLHLAREREAENAEWLNVQEQAKLVLEENQILIEQLSVQSKRSSEVNHVHKSEISRLSRSLVSAEADRNFYASELKRVSENHALMIKRFEAMGVNKIITIEEHGNALSELNLKIANIEDHHKAEIEGLVAKVEKSEEEFNTLLNERSMSKVELEGLEEKVESVLKAQIKWQRKATILEKKLMAAEEKERLLSEKLELALTAAERATDERNLYAEGLRAQIDEKNQTILELQDEQSMQKELDENLKSYKLVMKEKFKRVAQDHISAKKEFDLKEANYKMEIESLRRSLMSETVKNEHLLSSVRLSKSPF